MGLKSLRPGTILKGKSRSYKIEKVLGSGSFGITYLAEVVVNNPKSQYSAKVAIKEFFMKDFNGRQGSTVTSGSKDGISGKYLNNFIKEAAKLAKIQSDGVVKVFEEFQTNNTAYYVMQYLPGGSLNDAIAIQGKLPQGVALQYIMQISKALKDLHDTKMLHLDLKPSNVMLSSSYEAVLIDFGLSKQYTDDGEPESSTTIGAGTCGYAPIEQAQYRDGHGFPATMDIYALGATLYKMLSGAVPPDSSAILNDGFPSQILKTANVSSDVVDFTRRLMSPMRKSRPQDMNQVISELQYICAKNKIISKSDLAKCMSPEEASVANKDDDSEIEVYSVNGKPVNGHTGQKNYSQNNDSEVDKIEIRVNSKYIRFSITATPQELIVIKQQKINQSPVKTKFFYSPAKFAALKKKINELNLTTRSLAPNEIKPADGVELRVYREGKLSLDVATYKDGKSISINGNTDKLRSLAWKESGLTRLDLLRINCPKWLSSPKWLSKFLDYLRSPSKWIGYVAIVALVVIIYFQYDPISTYIYHNYCENVIHSWENRETHNYQLRPEVGGIGGVYYYPGHVWVANPKYRRSNPNEIYVSSDSFTLEGAEIVNQQDDYAFVFRDNQTVLFYKDNTILELPPLSGGRIHKSHSRLYEIAYSDDNYNDIYGIYNDQGKQVLPFSESNKTVIADNVIKEYDNGKTRYYDISGKPTSSPLLVILYDKCGTLMDIILALFLSIIPCVIAYLCYRLFKRWRR